MGSWISLAFIGLTIFVGAVLLINAAFGLLRAARGIDEDAVERRLSRAGDNTVGHQIGLIRQQTAGLSLKRLTIPFYSRFERFLLQTGSALPMNTVLFVSSGLAALAIVFLLVALPRGMFALAIPFGIAAGFSPVMLYLARLRTVRIAKFEEQLPDAIDLIVRSLRVGHPLSASLSIIARELPSPMREEFSVADNKVSYGLSISDAFREMYTRVPLADLGYLIAAFQIQEEAGGNLVESLAKLAGVIRERFRMFKKVNAITAEGRMSAWLLSVFPVVVGFLITLVKPDYFSHVADFPSFPYLVIITAVMLLLNIVVMMSITKIKV
jgi:tight adherence protein B